MVLLADEEGERLQKVLCFLLILVPIWSTFSQKNSVSPVIMMVHNILHGVMDEEGGGAGHFIFDSWPLGHHGALFTQYWGTEGALSHIRSILKTLYILAELFCHLC